MNRQVKGVLWLIVKWIAFPIGLLALGFYVIGPRLGATQAPPVAQKQTEKADAKPDLPEVKPDTSEPDNSATSQKFSAPDVDVSVEPGAQFAVHQGGTFHSRRRKKRRARAADGAAAPVENGNAPQGGSDGGGSTDGGGVG